MKLIINKRYSEWDKNSRRCLRRATFETGRIRDYIKINHDCDTLAFFNKKQLMGWVFFFPWQGKLTANIFINPRYRNRGVATALLAAAVKIYPNIALCQWDELTKYLFSKIKKQYGKRVTVYVWEKHKPKIMKMIRQHGRERKRRIK